MGSKEKRQREVTKKTRLKVEMKEGRKEENE